MALYEGFDRLVKDEVETAASLLQGIHDSYTKGEITLGQAKEIGADLLRNLKYGEDGYFWTDTVEGVNVVLLGKKDVEGTNRFNAQDKKGKYFVKEFIEKGTIDGGYIDYYFPKKGSDAPLPKRARTLEFKPFHWVIGTGNYVDDMEALVQKEEDTFKIRIIKRAS
jgi:methyl-accepting chemotaxis protein